MDQTQTPEVREAFARRERARDNYSVSLEDWRRRSGPQIGRAVREPGQTLEASPSEGPRFGSRTFELKPPAPGESRAKKEDAPIPARPAAVPANDPVAEQAIRAAHFQMSAARDEDHRRGEERRLDERRLDDRRMDERRRDDERRLDENRRIDRQEFERRQEENRRFIEARRIETVQRDMRIYAEMLAAKQAAKPGDPLGGLKKAAVIAGIGAAAGVAMAAPGTVGVGLILAGTMTGPNGRKKKMGGPLGEVLDASAGREMLAAFRDRQRRDQQQQYAAYAPRPPR